MNLHKRIQTHAMTFTSSSPNGNVAEKTNRRRSGEATVSMIDNEKCAVDRFLQSKRKELFSGKTTHSTYQAAVNLKAINHTPICVTKSRVSLTKRVINERDYTVLIRFA